MSGFEIKTGFGETGLDSAGSRQGECRALLNTTIHLQTLQKAGISDQLCEY